MRRTLRVKIGLECTECGQRNYSLMRSRAKLAQRLVLRKYCPACQRHTEHREGK